MRYLIISDLHGNWEALESVLQAAAELHDAVLCCGDIVGYGADPNRVTEWVRENAQAVIRGNHDRACAKLEGLEWFNPMAQAATKWTHKELTERNRLWLASLPSGPVEIENFQIVHGSPVDEDEYVLTTMEAADAFAFSPAGVTFFGHTHVQGIFEKRRMKTWRWDRNELAHTSLLGDEAQYLINPGSVGQPRDGDARAAFALYDSQSRALEMRRVPYDVGGAQKKIMMAELPPQLAGRLGVGS